MASSLEENKRQAVEREDYDEASRIKAELASILSSGPSQQQRSASASSSSLSPPLRQSPSRAVPSSANSQLREERPIRPSPPLTGRREGPSSATRDGDAQDPLAPPADFWGHEIDPDNSLPVAEPLSSSTMEESRFGALFICTDVVPVHVRTNKVKK